MPQRSPLIFWLLLAATISVDAVVASLVAGDRYGGLVHLTVAFYALIVSQLSLVCIWAALKLVPTVSTWAAPLVAVTIASFVAGSFAPLPVNFHGWTVYLNFFGYFLLHAVALLTLLWLLQRTDYWQRTTGVKRPWQFSLAQLLIAMTLTGVLVTLTRNNVFIIKDGATNIPEVLCCVVLAASAALLWSASWNWFLRLASVIGVALLLGAGINVVSFGPDILRVFEVFAVLQAYYLMQAIVLSIWLGVGPILPTASGDTLVVPIDSQGASS